MALVATTLSSAITSAKLFNIALTNTAGFGDKQLVKIDNEYCVQVGPATTTSGAGAITVRMRGAEGTAAVAHDVLAQVVTSATPTDFPAMAAGQVSILPSNVDDVVTLGQDVTITPPSRNTTYLIAKGSAIAITLNSATAAQQGVRMIFESTTGFAHVITYAAGFLGSTNTVATFAASVGAALETVVGVTGKISALASPSITFTL